jgi:hypothetical protein
MDRSQYFGFFDPPGTQGDGAKYMITLAMLGSTLAGIRIAKPPAKSFLRQFSFGILSAAKDRVTRFKKGISPAALFKHQERKSTK